jgi:predicted GIY-YIG superfamily endonuclease
MSSGWYVYILQCADGTFYTGITKDLTRRLALHDAGSGAKYTRGRGPLELVYHETQRTMSQALKRELCIKAMTRAQKRRIITRAVNSGESQ